MRLLLGCEHVRDASAQPPKRRLMNRFLRGCTLQQPSLCVCVCVMDGPAGAAVDAAVRTFMA